MSLMITGATILDGVSESPLEGHSLWIEADRIRAIGRAGDFPRVPPVAKVIDGRGKFVIPGLMNANVHLLCDVRPEVLARYWHSFKDLIVEAAQVALKNGLTTVFDTWGPRRFLIEARDDINSGREVGSRIFCAGNIVGFDGPYSPDFHPRVEGVISQTLTQHVNAIWVENVGRHLMWLTPEQVVEEAQAYMRRGIDFLKIASNDHYPGAFIAFSPRVQKRLVDAAHAIGITAQAHSMSVEGLHIALEAGCDLIQHANNSGPIPIPEETLALFARIGASAVVFPYTDNVLRQLLAADGSKEPAAWRATDINARNLIRSGVPLLLGNDAAIFAPEALSAPLFARMLTPEILAEGLPFDLAAGHFAWLKAMEQKECPPMQMLRAATANIARAYGKDRELGTLEAGKLADVIILDRDPLQSADHYRSIHAVIKAGALIDRSVLPARPLLTRPPEAPPEEEARYRPFFLGRKLPTCPTCRHE